MEMVDYSFERYLVSKKSVDDRALNQMVWEQMDRALPEASAAHPLRVLEIGSGVGTMVERAIEWGLLTHAVYQAIDASQANIHRARQRLPAWCRQQGYPVGGPDDWPIVVSHPGGRLRVDFKSADALVYLRDHEQEASWDLLIAHAFMDLVDLSSALPWLFRSLKIGGLFYFTINFDGLTVFEPEIDPGLEAQILDAYHRTMDSRIVDGKPAGESRTGRRLFAAIQQAGGQVLAAGSSDWVVFAGPEGYPQDEAYFLHFIFHTIATALAGDPDLEANALSGWLTERHAQVERGELVYIAHQMDFLGVIPWAAQDKVK